MKEIIEAINNRIKSPVLGYFSIAFVLCNWKVLFYLFFSNAEIVERFKYFDFNTNTTSLLIIPGIYGVTGAIIYPWINLLFTWLIVRPLEYKQIITLTSKNKLLIKEKEFEELRTGLLVSRERELINRAKRDEEIKTIDDDKLRVELQSQIDELRSQVGEGEINTASSKNTQTISVGMPSIYLELAKLLEKQGKVSEAEEYLKSAVQYKHMYERP